MFYYLSKIFDFLIMPYNVLLISLIVVLFKIRQRGLKWLVAFIFAGLYLQSNPYLVACLYRHWEQPPQHMDQLAKQYEAGIVLSGGLVKSHSPATPGYYDLERGSDRLLAGFFLYKRGFCRKLILTGSDLNLLLEQGRGEVQLAKELLVEWGVPADDIILETKARNTFENAVYTAQLLSRNSIAPEKSLLITSSYHMRRARACFRNAGIEMEGFPTDFMVNPESLHFRKALFPEPAAAEAFQKLWREWVGMLMYKLAGYC